MSEKLILTLSNGPLWTGIGMSCLLLFGFYFYFYRKNNFAASPSDIPRETPPKSLPPAVVRYIWRPGFDARCLLSGVLSAVMKDVYRIKWRDESFSIYLNKMGAFERLSGDERAALSFNNKNYLERLGIGKKKNQFIRRAAGRMEDYIDEKYGKYLFKKHLLVLIGLGFSLLTGFILNAVFTDIPTIYTMAYFLFIVPLSVGLAYGAYYAVKTKNWIALPMCAVFGFVGLIMAYHIETSIAFDHHLFPALIPLLAVNLGFYQKLPHRKPEGEKLHVQIMEFRNYLAEKVTQEYDLEKSEYYLIPYLVALDIPFENNEYFSSIFSENPAQMGRLPGSPVS